jgi:hypothetical protein
MFSLKGRMEPPIPQTRAPLGRTENLVTSVRDAGIGVMILRFPLTISTSSLAVIPKAVEVAVICDELP